MWEKIKTYSIIGLVLMALVFLSLWRCDRPKTGEVIKYIKGATKIQKIKGSPDTVVVKEPVYLKAKSTVKLVHDTIHHWYTSSDTVQVYPYTLLIKDTLRNGKIDRDVIMTGYDSTFFITRVDTVKSLRVDTVIIEKRGKLSKVAISLAFGGGYAVGVATAIVVK
jgi:hypothetical protein